MEGALPRSLASFKITSGTVLSVGLPPPSFPPFHSFSSGSSFCLTCAAVLTFAGRAGSRVGGRLVCKLCFCAGRGKRHSRVVCNVALSLLAGGGLQAGSQIRAGHRPRVRIRPSPVLQPSSSPLPFPLLIIP